LAIVAWKKMLWGKRRDSCKIVASINLQLTELLMQKPHDNSKASPAAFVQDNTLIAVIELSLSNWLVAGLIPGVSREPLKKLEPNPEDLLKLLHGWRDEAIKAGRPITRIAVAYETGRDSFWLARWLRERGIDAHVIHATSVTVSREHRRAKTDRLDTAMLKRGFLGWLRGERGHCTVAIVPTMEEEDAKRPHREREGLVHEQTRAVNRMKSALIQYGVRNFNPKLRKASVKLETVRTPEGKSLPPNTIAALRRDMERLKIIKEQIKAIEQARLQQFEQKPEALVNRMVYLLVRIYGLGLETADLLAHELLSRTLRDRKAVARYAGLTGSPDESGSKRREKGLSRSGNARVRKIMIQLAWRMVKFQPDSALVQWFKQRTESAKGSRKPMIVALARKLIIALWRYANDGVIPEGFKLHSAA
jgi:transposase